MDTFASPIAALDQSKVDKRFQDIADTSGKDIHNVFNEKGLGNQFEITNEEYKKMYEYLYSLGGTQQIYFASAHIPFKEFCFIIAKKLRSLGNYDKIIHIEKKITSSIFQDIASYFVNHIELESYQNLPLKPQTENSQEYLKYIQKILNYRNKSKEPLRVIIKNPTLEEYTILKKLFPNICVYIDCNNHEALKEAIQFPFAST